MNFLLQYKKVISKVPAAALNTKQCSHFFYVQLLLQPPVLVRQTVHCLFQVGDVPARCQQVLKFVKTR